MDNLVVNSCLAVLNFKRSDFEERSKIASFDKTLMYKIKEIFDKCGSGELEVMLRYKQSGEVELIPTENVFTKGLYGENVPIKELRPRFESTMSPEEFMKSLNQENSESKSPEKDNTKLFESIAKSITNAINKYKEKGIEITKSHKEKLKEKVNELLNEKEIVEGEFWTWYLERRKPKIVQQETTVEKEPENIEKYDTALEYIIKVLKDAKDRGKSVTQDARKRFIDAVLEKRDIDATKFWDWYKEKQQQAKKLKAIASILGTTLTKTADFLTELNPDEEKPAFDEETNKEVTVNKETTTEGRPVVTIGDKDNTEKKTYDQNSPELKNITDDLSQIVAFTSEQRIILAELGFTI